MFQIDQQIMDAVARLNECVVKDGKFVNPETNEEFSLDVLEQLGIEREEKLKSYLYVYREDYPARIAGLRAMLEFFQAKADAFKDKVDNEEEKRRLFGLHILEINPTEDGKWKSSDKTMSYYTKVTKSTVILDAKQIPLEYLREIPAKYEPDKTKIKEAIESGKTVSGAELKTKKTLM